MVEMTYTAEEYRKALALACPKIIEAEKELFGYSSRTVETLEKYYIAEACK